MISTASPDDSDPDLPPTVLPDEAGTDDPVRTPEAASPRRSRELVRTRRVRIGLSAAVVLVLVALGLAALAAAARSATSAGGTSIALADPTAADGTTSKPGEAAASGATAPETVGVLYVHVLGAVAAPGLYTLAADARVVDAIAAAGGFTAEADAGSVNLARTLADGEQIVVTTPGEAPAAGSGAGGSAGGASGGAGEPATGPIDLNTATADQLETLPRIGPALAERIIAWRTDNGPFRLVDELLAVPGIGDATLAGLDGLVTV